MLEGARVLDADVQAETCIRNEDPGVLLYRFSQQLIEDRGGGDMLNLFQPFGLIHVRGGILSRLRCLEFRL